LIQDIEEQQAALRKEKAKKRAEERKATRVKVTEELRWLRSHFDLSGWGYKYQTPEGEKIRRANTNETIVSACNKSQGVFTSKLTFQKIQNHFLKSETVYYASRSYAKKKWGDHIIFLADIDCQKSQKKGSKQGGISFARHLKKNVPCLGEMGIEPSTGGTGTHGYVRLYVGDATNETVNGFLQRLEAALMKYAARIGADIEAIEIKGRCSESTWKKGKMIDHKSGQLAKLPRSLSVVPKKAITLHDISAFCKEMEALEELPVLKIAAGTEKVVKKSRSAGTQYLDEGTLAGCKEGGRFHRAAAQIMGNSALKIDCRKSVTVEDTAIFLMLGEFFTTKSMIEDGSMPWARFQKFWQCLYEAGDVERPFQPNRYKAIQNLLSDKGMIDWEDCSYIPPVRIDGEKVAVGQSMKWKMSEECLSIVAESTVPTLKEEQKVSLVTTNQEPAVEAVKVRPEMRLNLDFFREAKEKHHLKQLQEWEKQQEVLRSLNLA